MEADFSGYATKAGLKCTDGRTIMPDAFKHQDTLRVPLVWQHGHRDPENVLGHAILENRQDGVYAYGFFNDSAKAKHTHGLVEHGDITMMSIWANDLIERGGRVLHGAIREVSLVLSGANPGAVIENVTIRHSDGDEHTLDDEVIIYTGLQLEHSSSSESDGADATVQDVYDSMNPAQKEVLHFMLGQALESANGGDVQHAAGDAMVEGETVQDVYDSMSEKQKQVLHYMLGQALAAAGDSNAQHDNLSDNSNSDETQEGSDMKHNVFEDRKTAAQRPTLTHADISGIVADATRRGSLKDAVADYALQHGINNIDVLFPEARSISDQPEFLKRRTEWVNNLLSACRKSPFSRIKTLSADLTVDEARAKGYIKGNLKKEEFFGVSKRVTTPSTVYKKQKLDRDDMLDITDFDVVAWLKGEMRIMLDEEIARAILIGDGRDVAHEDKINEGNIRPIAKDHELYTTTVNVNIDDANSSVVEVIDAIIRNRKHYKGTGLPTMFTTESYIAEFLLLKDSLGRRIYKTLEELASELRVAGIVPVEVMEEDPSVVAVLVNPIDYVIGADRGGDISMFDDFDIDYNAYKYLIETRISGALVRLKSAIVIKKVAAALVTVTPVEPTFSGTAVTIVNQTGVVYKNAATNAVMNAAGSPYAVADGDSIMVIASPAVGYYFPSSEDDTWVYTNEL